MTNPIKQLDQEIVTQLHRFQNQTVNYAWEYSNDVDYLHGLFDYTVDDMRHILWSHFLNDLQFDIENKLEEGQTIDQIFEDYRK